jgi:hypothetical protein
MVSPRGRRCDRAAPQLEALLQQEGDLLGLLVDGGLRRDHAAVLLVHRRVLNDLPARVPAQAWRVHGGFSPSVVVNIPGPQKKNPVWREQACTVSGTAPGTLSGDVTHQRAA